MTIKWKIVSEERYMEMLEILPPIGWSTKGFLVGEPWRHDDKGRGMYAPFLSLNGRYAEGDGPITIQDFRAFTYPQVEEIFRNAEQPAVLV